MIVAIANTLKSRVTHAWTHETKQLISFICQTKFAFDLFSLMLSPAFKKSPLFIALTSSLFPDNNFVTNWKQSVSGQGLCVSQCVYSTANTDLLPTVKAYTHANKVEQATAMLSTRPQGEPLEIALGLSLDCNNIKRDIENMKNVVTNYLFPVRTVKRLKVKCLAGGLRADIISVL